jgi:hypothetical protein
MTKTQVDNIIHFSFHFHQSMGCKIEEFSPDYIEEKFKYYFGIKPRKITDSEIKILDYYKEFTEWKRSWRTEYTDHLFFIFKINTKGLTIRYEKVENAWKPLELVSLFEEYIGDPNMITDWSYNGLHQLVKNEVDEWLSNDVIANDYRILMRDVKIDNILS